MRWLHVSIDVLADDAETAGRFWSGASGWSLGDPWRNHPEFRSLLPPDGDPYSHLQTVAEAPGVHFDVASEGVDAESARLIACGASLEADFGIWRVLRSPGGFDFCVVPTGGHKVPQARVWAGQPGEHRSRLVQICIDSPATSHDAEVEFWRDATEWEFQPSSDEEFAGKLIAPAGGPVQLLFQRLGPDDRGLRTRAHIDLGTDDLAAEAARLVELGATQVGRGDGWILMRDPTGMPFCVTGNRPDPAPAEHQVS